MISERDILGTQLVRRNDELALLYEKIKIQQSTLNKGEIQYNQRLEDIRVLKLEIKKLRREKGILQKSVANVEDLRSVHTHYVVTFLLLFCISLSAYYLYFSDRFYAESIAHIDIDVIKVQDKFYPSICILLPEFRLND